MVVVRAALWLLVGVIVLAVLAWVYALERMR